MKLKTILALAVSTTFLAACGGGGGDSAPAASVGPLTKYAGVWLDGCNGHEQTSHTLVASNNGSILSLNIKSEVFDNAGCTGAVVATGTYPAPMITMQHIETVPSASVKYLTGTTSASSIDRITASSTAGNNLTYVGSGVTSSTVSAGATKTHIVYNNGSTDITTNAVPTTSIQAALLLGAGTFSTLVPINGSTTSFQEQDRFISSVAPAASAATPAASAAKPATYNYAIHDGSYSCTKSGSGTVISFNAKFSATSIVLTLTGSAAGLGGFEYKDKVGFVGGLPYYSHFIPLTSNAESALFFNGNLTLVTTPASDVPDLFEQRPSSVSSCKKTA